MDSIAQARQHYWERSLIGDQVIMDGAVELAEWLGDAWEWMHRNRPLTSAIGRIAGGSFTLVKSIRGLFASIKLISTGKGTMKGLLGIAFSIAGILGGGGYLISGIIDLLELFSTEEECVCPE